MVATCKSQVQDAVFHRILLGGDQLTSTRARSAKRLKMNGISPVSRLEGLCPCAEDWHTKMNLLEVCFHHYLYNVHCALYVYTCTCMC